MPSCEKRPLRGALTFALLALIAAAVVGTASAVRVRMQRANDRELMRVGLEDVARRVKANDRNLATVIELNNTALLVKARALGDSAVNNQQDDGRSPTGWFCKPDHYQFWINCHIATIVALQQLAGE